MSRALPALALLLAACTTSTKSSYPTCSITDVRVEPAQAAPGERVRIYAAPLTQAWDTTVTVGSQPATVLRLQREGCDDCDNCTSEDTAATYDVCPTQNDGCRDVCESCVQSVQITVPAVAAGSQKVELRNWYGVSETAWLEVTGGDTGETGDSGDTGDTADTGHTGDSGDTGHTGDSGDTADTGGDTGHTGDSGDTADTGGDTGHTGDSGGDSGKKG